MNIEDIRTYCLKKEGVTEDAAFGPDTILFRLCDKIFACLDLNRPNIVVVNMLNERAIDLREHYWGIHGAWHWNKSYWSDVELDADVEEHMVYQLLDESYDNIRLKLPQKTLYNFKGVPEGWYHAHYAVLDSAMNALRDLKMSADEAPFQLITADFQTAGRGQGKNTWESEDKQNLLFAFRFFPTMVKAVDQFRLLDCISVAVAKTVEKFYDKRVAIKWPNDIYCDDKKICGILIEHDLCGAYLSETRCGIGINVNQENFVGSAPNPVSLRQLKGKPVDRAAVLRNFLSYFMKLYTHNIINDEGGIISLDYMKRFYRLSGWYPFRDKEGEFEARLEGLQDDGQIMLRDRQGRVRIYAHKEVEFILTKKEYFETDDFDPFA